jgi:hypothetical protein
MFSCLSRKKHDERSAAPTTSLLHGGDDVARRYHKRRNPRKRVSACAHWALVSPFVVTVGRDHRERERESLAVQFARIVSAAKIIARPLYNGRTSDTISPKKKSQNVAFCFAAAVSLAPLGRPGRQARAIFRQGNV